MGFCKEGTGGRVGKAEPGIIEGSAEMPWKGYIHRLNHPAPAYPGVPLQLSQKKRQPPRETGIAPIHIYKAIKPQSKFPARQSLFLQTTQPEKLLESLSLPPPSSRKGKANIASCREGTADQALLLHSRPGSAIRRPSGPRAKTTSRAKADENSS